MTNVPKVSATACIGIPGKTQLGHGRHAAQHQAFQQRIDWSCHRDQACLKIVTSATMNPPMGPPPARGPTDEIAASDPPRSEPTPGPAPSPGKSADARLMRFRDCHPLANTKLPIRMRRL